MSDGALEVDLALVGSLSMSDRAGWVCVLHWGLDDIVLCEWMIEGVVRAEFASLAGREFLGGFESV